MHGGTSVFSVCRVTRAHRCMGARTHSPVLIITFRCRARILVGEAPQSYRGCPKKRVFALHVLLGIMEQRYSAHCRISCVYPSQGRLPNAEDVQRLPFIPPAFPCRPMRDRRQRGGQRGAFFAKLDKRQWCAGRREDPAAFLVLVPGIGLCVQAGALHDRQVGADVDRGGLGHDNGATREQQAALCLGATFCGKNGVSVGSYSSQNSRKAAI